MGEINKEWHADNRMPRNPKLDQRIEWHSQHSKHCAYREVPEEIAHEIEKRQVAGAIIGVVKDAARDLSTNPRHYRGFGKSK